MSSKNSNVDSELRSLLSISLKFQGINKILEARHGLSVVQWSLLKTLLEMPAVSPLYLAKALEVTPGTLTQTLARLSRKDFIFICDDPKDARKKIVSITRKGRDVLVKLNEVYESTFAAISQVTAELNLINRVLDENVRFRLTDSGIEFEEGEPK